MDWKVKHKLTTIKLLGENLGENLHDIGLGNTFLDMKWKE